MPWLLCDYGQVLSLPPPDEEWKSLCQEAGYGDAGAFHDAYWRHRPDYDSGDLTASQYWSFVATAQTDLARLVKLDVGIWLHQDKPAVEAAMRAKERGFRLALFSNAPVEVAEGIDALDWLAAFERRFYSCWMRSAKPSRQAYEHVIAELDADPRDIWFFDDRQMNVEAASRMGINARLYLSPEQFDELRAG